MAFAQQMGYYGMYPAGYTIPPSAGYAVAPPDYGYGPVRVTPQAPPKRASPYVVAAPPKSVADKPKSEGRPGDWTCSSCSNLNYANRLACNKCKIPKPGMAMFQHLPQMPNQPANMRPGDWVCRACSNHNYANRESCNKCKVAKSVYIAKSGLREGDWLCPACANHNFADKVNCNKCGASKGNASVPAGVVPKKAVGSSVRDGDWFCPACNNHNYANRVNCNKCNQPKAM